MLKILSILPKRFTTRLIQGQGLLQNAVTLGVRVIVESDDNNVLLVRHSYLSGWYLPGGGVERGETLVDAAARELREEAGVEASGGLELLGVYLNREAWGRDHVGLFVARGWSEAAGYLQPNAEIIEARFFSRNTLPPDTTPATLRRLADYRAGTRHAGGHW